MVTLKEALSELANVSRELNAESDPMNETIAAIEAAIGKAAPGISAWLTDTTLCGRTTWTSNGAARFRYWLIGYDRGPSGKFGLVAQERECPFGEDQFGPGGFNTDEEEPVGEVRALSSCPREVRVEAGVLLERLVVRLTETARQSLDKLRKARSQLVE